MLFTQQIIHSLHRVKGTQRHFNKNSVPVTHCAVPQAPEAPMLSVLYRSLIYKR